MGCRYCPMVTCERKPSGTTALQVDISSDTDTCSVDDGMVVKKAIRAAMNNEKMASKSKVIVIFELR